MASVVLSLSSVSSLWVWWCSLSYRSSALVPVGLALDFSDLLGLFYDLIVVDIGEAGGHDPVHWEHGKRGVGHTVKKIVLLRMSIRIYLDLYLDIAGPRNPVRAGYISGYSWKIFLFFYLVLPL